MIIEVTQRENFFQRFWAFLRGELQTISDGEMLHFKGVGNSNRGKKEVGDFLTFVNVDPLKLKGTALCTYQIVAIDDKEAKLELLEYNIRR
ncbi:hypothetical protein [Winogradskyella luteola]|uniref:Uncharacterized protein n=1 Tax=Winogradskyella luteola TaxID=2828330 RepID=A0A9X1F840_9FLAO|nr:hypothetical protein [Winogradskyella luteola]MBV7268363.1 hypothetical protein [Winogradskyella luteola]